MFNITARTQMDWLCRVHFTVTFINQFIANSHRAIFTKPIIRPNSVDPVVVRFDRFHSALILSKCWFSLKNASLMLILSD